ncbi:hypothetical protein ANANG_G00320310, partial [Anguilla anguilla]
PIAAGQHVCGAPGVLHVPAAVAEPGPGGVQRGRDLRARPPPPRGRERVHAAAVQIPADPHGEEGGRVRGKCDTLPREEHNKNLQGTGGPEREPREESHAAGGHECHAWHPAGFLRCVKKV